MNTSSHIIFLRRCLALAENGRGLTGINPMVGAVLVRDGMIIAEGFHEGFGNAHAERQLLEKSDQKISANDILYVNLEPCCHTDKKTPPCAQFIVEKGIKIVVYGLIDPNPNVAGRGIQFLQSHGVEVIGPVLPEECARLNRGFVSVMRNGRPWITLKSAMTVDGRFANASGSPRLMITSEEQDRWSHLFLRARHDAILVGIGTVLADDPELTVRPHPLLRQGFGGQAPAPFSDGGRGEPYRIILDPHFRIPLTARVVNGELAEGTIVVRKEPEDSEEPEEPEEKMRILEKRGVRILTIPLNRDHKILNNGSGYLPAEHSVTFDWQSFWQALTTPSGDFHGISSILVEGGSRTWGAFREAKTVDEEVILVGG
ncbi:MAG: bifunctional diaminohydroxyphosphoribosylaminopyrimidine deaminase/5-amino-6-(5-phosphoribosylamino)uracil reductase RibD [Candidatus Peribacteraceae bacterium]|nr:bifunctional diaminohydroxyphosphoribosylaminopyrimidine deaminase/5-amino-6-(5-phosphoribosylamino)uracil reductase RibD [Candidatus Peribacteraceae bacterium]